jgi:transposase
MITMDTKSQLIVEIIAKTSAGDITINNATKLLNCSRRTIERYLQKYQSLGIKFIIHGNTGKLPPNKIDEALKKRVQSLIKQKYYDVNLQHLSELLSNHENIFIKRETLRKWAHDIHHVKRAKKRRSKIRKRRERMAASGLLLQMDGSTHRWFGNEKTCLIAIIDDATSELYAEFFPSETTIGCLKVLRYFISKNGLFKTLYVDRAGIFSGPKRCNFSQVKRACEELGITIIFANSPQGKGRVERAFDTLQDRLVPELRLQGINSIENANKFLHQIFLPQTWFNKFVVKAENAADEFVPVPKHLNIEEICIIKEYRKIRNDHTFSYNNKMYLINSNLKHSIVKQKIEIHTKCDSNGFLAYFSGELLDVNEVIEPTKLSMYDLEIQRKIDAINLADKLGNVTEAARISGCSRETIYRNRRLLRENGPMALKRTFNHHKHHKNRTTQDIEKITIRFSLENPHLGQSQVSAQLKTTLGIEISPSGVRNIWLREKLNNCALRLQKAKNIDLNNA